MKHDGEMPPSEKHINSLNYWEQRFAGDWEEKQGREQSRFFSDVAAELMPEWFLNYSKEHRLSICDWGCAQGDGTASLASSLGLKNVIGVDFSPEAIQKARAQHPEQEYLCIDLLESTGNESWDVIFSSNTLEHFESPWHVFDTLSKFATHFIVLLLPFREFERIEEHFCTFDYPNIPFAHGSWRLTHCRSISTQEHSPSYWPGEQILLIFANNTTLPGIGLTLADIEIESTANALAELKSADAKYYSNLYKQLEGLKAELASTEVSLNAISNDKLTLENQLNQLTARHKHLTGLYTAILNSLSWKITKPLRFTRRFLRHGLQASDKHAVKSLLKRGFDRFPASPALKQKMLSHYRRYKGLPAPAMTNAVPMVQEIGPSLKPAPRLPDMPDYIFWGVIDWHFRHQRPQQLAQALASSGRRVFYVSVNLVDSSEAGFNIEQLDEAGRLFQINLYAKGAPAVYYEPAGVDTAEQLRASIGRVLQWADSRASVSIIQHAFWYETAFALPNTKVVYDCMDHHEGFGNVSDAMLAIENALVTDSDLTITTSSWLDETVGLRTSRRALIRNAGEYVHFATAPENLHIDPASRKIIGYYGAIAEWFDVDLIAKLAQRFTEHTILLIGADTVNAASQLKKYQNIIFTGEQPYSELPRYLHAFDVCLLPFKVIPLTLATNPVKVYEYLSAGKPVVSVDLPEIRQFDGLVHAASNHDAFIEAVDVAMSQPSSPEVILQRQSFAKHQTWFHRAEQLIEQVENADLKNPRISVIVVTYNNLVLTKACLDSLDQYTDYDNYEVIVVDNASSDGSPDFLREWAQGAENRRLVLNDENLGFAAANNQGLAIADGEYLTLLNNDTFVTPGWLRTLSRHLQRDPTLGLLGPVTNNIGNEAKIQIHYSNMEEMIEKSLLFTRKHVGKIHKMHTAAFFCVMFPRKIYEKVGPLDEAFGRGFFEDDDYCRRVELEGYGVACAEDVFVHHHLSASFNQLRSAERQALFDQNKAIYEAKWGSWVPHCYRKSDQE